MKTQQPAFVQEPSEPAFAVLTHKSGATPIAPPFSARIRAILTAPEVRVPAMVTEMIQRQAEFTKRQGNSEALTAELIATVQHLDSLALAKEWSQRKLAAKLGLCPRTWRRIRSLSVNPADWLPKVRTAMCQLKPDFEFSSI